MPVETDRAPVKEKVYIKSSPVFELSSAFHVLAAPDHHGFLEQWINDMKSRLTKEESDVLNMLSKMYNQGLEINNCVFDIGEFDRIENFLESFRNYDITDFLYSFFEENIDREKVNECINSPKESFEILRKEVGDWIGAREIATYSSVIEKRYEVHDRIYSVLSKIYDEDFIELVKSQAKCYAAELQSLSEKLNSKSPLDIAQEIMGKKFERVSPYHTYYFVPSYFIYPHNLRIFNDRTLVQIFSYGHDMPNLEEKLDKINSSLSIISDKTRLKILRLLISGKSYGKVIANRLGLTTATISHHLDILKEAGFVTEERTENVKYFIYNESRVEEVIHELQEYLYNKQ